MQFRQLEYFVALAREQHFARAADSCFVSQPALSGAIRRLEREVGVSLVRRGHVYEGLTDEGERLLLWARRILADHDALREDLAALRHGQTSRLRLGVADGAAVAAASIIGAFCEKYRTARVDVVTQSSSTDLLDGLDRFEVDAVIVTGDATLGRHRRSVVLVEEELRLVGESDLLRPLGPRPSWTALEQLPLCLLSVDQAVRQKVDATSAALGIHLQPQVETDTVAGLIAQVSSGRSISVAPASWFESASAAVDVASLRLAEPVVTIGLTLATSARAPLPVTARAFSDLAAALAARGHFNGRASTRSAPVRQQGAA